MAAPGNVLELYDDRPDRLRGVGPRPVPPRDARRLPAGASRAEVVLADSAAGRGRVRAPDRRAQPHAPDRAARRRGAAARVPLRDRLAGGPAGAEGALPGRRARAAGDVRDAVRRRRAPDALLHPPRGRPVRGARPPLRRPLRARVRGRAAVGGDLRLVDARRRDADDAAALAALAGPGRRPGRARARVRGLPARGRLAGRRGDGRGAALQRAAAARRRRCRAALVVRVRRAMWSTR